MRIALISLSVGGAGGQYTYLLARYLSRLGTVCLVVPGHFEFSQACIEAGVEVQAFPVERPKWKTVASLFSIKSIARIWSKLNAFRPDVVHILTGAVYPPAVAWYLLSRYRRWQVVLTIHDAEPHPGDKVGAAARLAEDNIYRYVDGVHIHTSRFLWAVERFPYAKSAVIPHGSFAELFNVHSKARVERERAVLFFGRIEYYKGVDLLAEAAFSLPADVRVIIAGPGIIDKEVQKWIQRAPERFEIHNRYLSSSEVAVLFQRASVCVMPYRQASQSSVPLISAGFGVPVVACAVGALRDDVPAVGGRLVELSSLTASRLAEDIMVSLNGGDVVDPVSHHFEPISSRFIGWYMSATATRSLAI